MEPPIPEAAISLPTAQIANLCCSLSRSVAAVKNGSLRFEWGWGVKTPSIHIPTNQYG